MEQGNKPKCYVFGGDTLLIQCVEVLVKKNFDVLGVVSRNKEIEEWVENQNIPFLDLDAHYSIKMRDSRFDYLFSITHLEIIPTEILDLAEIGNINFHDGPLPQYAGLNAPAWALINNEKSYGITWHFITPELDKGDVLHQELFDVSADETALSLNTKCFAAALETFPQLVDKLLDNRTESRQQDQTQRSYFSRYQKPEAACIIDWSESANDIECLIRGLDFGSYSNPIGSAKLFSDDKAYIVRSAVSQSGQFKPGEIIRIEEGELEVGTGDGSLVITSVEDLAGKKISVADVVSDLNIAVGKKLNVVSGDAKRFATELNGEFCRYEDFWSGRLSTLELVELPFQKKEVAGQISADYQSSELDLNINFEDPNRTNQEYFIAALILLFSRLVDTDSFNYSLSEARLREKISGFESIFFDINSV